MVVSELTVKLEVVCAIVSGKIILKLFVLAVLVRALERLRKIGDQLVFLAELVDHVEIAVLVVLVIGIERHKRVGGVGQNIRVFRPVAELGKRRRADVLRQFGADGSVGTFFQRHEEYIHHAVHSRCSLGNTRVVADLDLLDAEGLHLVEQNAHVAAIRAVVDAYLVIAEPVVVSVSEDGRVELEDVEEGLLAIQLHSLRVNSDAVSAHLQYG